jgi:hypothetical protein
MWSLVEKNPKETGVLEKYNTKARLKKNSKNDNVFLNRDGEHIAGYLIHLKFKKPNEKAKQHKLEQIEWNFNNLCPTICRIFYNLLHKMCMSYNLGQ